jgi:hypothetical protein
MTETRLTPFSYFDLLEACVLPGCPVCRLEAKIVGNYLDVMLYENVNDPDTQAALCKSRGLCREHAWLLTEISSSPALGIAILYRSVAREIRGELTREITPETGRPAAGKIKKAPAGTNRMIRSLEPQGKCPACDHRDKLVDFALNAMLEALDRGDERMRASLRKSQGICRPHLLRALTLAKTVQSSKELETAAAEKLDLLLHDLDEFIRKNDYRFTHEGFGAEGDSWRRILGWMTGEK